MKFESNSCYFTIDAPKQWKSIEVKGVDSFVGLIVVSSSDTLEFDLGYYSNSLTEMEDENNEGNSIVKSNVVYDNFDGKKVKILKPKRVGVGITGIYIDSLWKVKSDIVRFNLYGSNLTSRSQNELLRAIKSLKFYRKELISSHKIDTK